MICDRPTEVGITEDPFIRSKYGQCMYPSEFNGPILIIGGWRAHGRTGNNLIEFMHAVQQARDSGYQLGVMRNSWATKRILSMWMATEERDDWIEVFERAFCVKVFQNDAELEGWDVMPTDTKKLFYYQSQQPLAEYIESQSHILRSLYRNYNTGVGKTLLGGQAQDMCSGIDAIFGDERQSVIYSVIHSRYLEGEPGIRLLAHLSQTSGCDPTAALEMRPEYVKSILRPLGLLDYPIVFITDGENSKVLRGLLDDPDIGPMIETVPEKSVWLGGDITLATMANVFIGKCFIHAISCRSLCSQVLKN